MEFGSLHPTVFLTLVVFGCLHGSRVGLLVYVHYVKHAFDG